MLTLTWPARGKKKKSCLVHFLEAVVSPANQHAFYVAYFNLLEQKSECNLLKRYLVQQGTLYPTCRIDQ